ncbi:MAG: VTT domain-containing protein [Thermomicrobiaceae bacterium]|nr:VTT domain-containing protein [Thermomicrobiaceae bacterium]
MPHFDLVNLVKTVGYLGLFGIIFAETGLFVGFFLPGDSLLFTAGFLASQGMLNIWLLLPLCFVAATLGGMVGYSFGARIGPRIFRRDDSLLFRRQHLVRASEFFERHGGKAVILARFMPIVRTFTPIVAGVGRMHYRRYALFNAIGAVLWAVGVTLAGYFLGSAIPNVDRYLLPIIFLIILASLAPGALHVLRENRVAISAAVRRQVRR